MAKIATMKAAPSKKQAAANKKKYESSRSILDNISDWWKSQKNKGGTNVAGYIQRNYEGSGLQKIIKGIGKNTNNNTTYKPTDITGILGDYESSDGSGGYGGYGGSGGGGGSYARVPDISGLLAAYDQQAEASRKIAQNSYDTTRNDLLTSLKRFQEQNAKDVQNQKQGYLSEQASLESAREQANRQNRIAAAARGLGGSGLQQLAQLQTLLAQGEDISDAALSNQKAMDALRAALQQKEDDTNSSLAKAQTTLDNALSQIEANLAQQKAQTIYENEMAKLSGGSGGGGGYSRGRSSSYDSGFDAGLTGLLGSLNAELATYGGTSESKALSAINKAYGGTYGKAKNLNQAKTILGSAYADAIANSIGKNTSSANVRNAINQANAMIANLKSKKKK